MTLEETRTQLEALGNEKMRAQNTKHGAGDNQFGVRRGDVRKLAKTIKTNHELATARGGKVKTVFPDWFKDALRPEAERSDDKDRELVRWRNRAPDADGVRVYARRAFCALKEGADPSQELKKKDFEVAKGPAQLIADLPAGSKRYRPRHDGIDEALPAAPETEYSTDQFYDVLVLAYNSAGSSKRHRDANHAADRRRVIGYRRYRLHQFDQSSRVEPGICTIFAGPRP